MAEATVIVILALIAIGVWVNRPHSYVIERVKDGNGNDAFLRIDVEHGEECAVGHGWAIVRAGKVPTDTYMVPFCR